MPLSVLVVGLGELGEAVVSALTSHPERKDATLSVLLRSEKPTQTTWLASNNVTPVYGDVVQDSQTDLAQKFSGHDVVIICTGMFLHPSIQMKFAAAALEGHVKRYFPWQFGIDYDIVGRGSGQDMFDGQLDVRALLRNQQLVDGKQQTAWVIVSTGMFISFLFEEAFGIVRLGKSNIMNSHAEVVAIGSWDNSITVTAPKDIGSVVANLVFVDKDASGVIYVAGDTVSMKQLADIVERVTGSPVSRSLKTIPTLQSELEQDPSDMMKKYRLVFAHGRGVAWDKNTSYNQSQGMSMQSVDEWARENLASR